MDELLKEGLAIYEFVNEHGALTSLIIFALSVVVEKSKTIKLNPFSFMGELLTGTVMQTVDKNQKITENKIDDLKTEINEVKKENKILSEKIEKARQDSIDRYNESSKKYDELKVELRYEMTANTMKQYRVDFFRFEEGILRGVKYTKEHWHNMRNKVLEYETFCDDNDKFINSECENAMNTILSEWEKHPWEDKNE